jgi:hypothetical protein
VITAILYGMYQRSKRQYLTFRAAAGEIAIDLNGDQYDRALSFMEAVLYAKNQRSLGDTPAASTATAQ